MIFTMLFVFSPKPLPVNDFVKLLPSGDLKGREFNGDRNRVNFRTEYQLEWNDYNHRYPCLTGSKLGAFLGVFGMLVSWPCPWSPQVHRAGRMLQVPCPEDHHPEILIEELIDPQHSLKANDQNKHRCTLPWNVIFKKYLENISVPLVMPPPPCHSALKNR